MQSRPRISFALVALALLTAGVPAANGPLEAADGAPPVFEVVSGRLEAHPAETSEAADEVLVQVDHDLIQRDPDAVSVALPGGGVATAKRTWWNWISADEYHWFGELDDVDAAGAVPGRVSFHYHRGRLTGTLLTGGAAYRLVPEDGLHRLERNETPHGSCGVADVDFAAEGLRSIAEGLRSMPGAAGSDTDCVTPASNVTVDVMVLYPLTLKSQAQSVQTYASQEVATANSLFAASQVKITYSLRYVGLITGLQPPGPNNDPQAPATRPVLDWLNDQFATPAIDTEVELLRKAHGADMIAIVVPSHPQHGNCGVANLVARNTSGVEVLSHQQTTPFGTRAFSVVELGCGPADYTFAHELGHNYGMRHNETRLSSAVYPWAYGYEIPLSPSGKVATVMACTDNLVPCDRVGHFSNPDVLYQQQYPTGQHSSQSSEPTHNACVANLRRTQYRNFAVRPATPAPVLTITSPAEGATVAAGVPFTLTASATDSPDGNLAAQVQWTSDRAGFLGTGSPRSVTLNLAGPHLITATVTDSTGTTVPYSIRLIVTETDPPRRFIDRPSHNELVTGVFPAHGWATDASGVTSVTFKVDGVPVNLGNFVYGTHRADVCSVHADLNDPNCPFVGWSGSLDTRQLTNGTHTLTMTVKDLSNNTAIMNRTFRTTNVSTVGFVPIADAWVSQTQPNTNFGGDLNLQMRATGSNQTKHAYMKFQVSGITRPVQSARLRLRTQSVAFDWYSVYWMTVNSWSEFGITWNNASLDHYMYLPMGPQPANTMISLDVTPAVSGNGTYTFGMVGPDVAGLAVYSREATHWTLQPSLEVTY